jgi:O-antigen/teichoic acid export membrane protein
MPGVCGQSRGHILGALIPRPNGKLTGGAISDPGISRLIDLAKQQALALDKSASARLPGSDARASVDVGKTRNRREATASPGFSWATKVRAATREQWKNPLSRGGHALLVNTGLTGVLGFAYWTVAARLFSTYAVGVAGALVAATTLFSGIGQLNLSGMLMRFLPRAREKSRKLVLTTYACAVGASGLLASVSLVGVRLFASPGSPLRLDTLESVALVLAVTATAIFTIQDSVLIGLRRAIWVPVENGSFGVAKIGLLFVLAPLGTAFAVFGAWMIPLTLTIPLISAALFFRFLPQAPRFGRTVSFGRRMRAKILRFTVGDATGGLFTQAWTNLLPVIITVSLGPSANALFFTSFLFSSTLDQVATNYASPLIVEIAHVPDKMVTLIRSALRHIFVIVFPAAAGLALMSPLLLRVFGEKYVSAVPLLCLLVIACLPKAISVVFYAYCRVQRTTNRSAVLQAYVCVVTLVTVVLLARSIGLTGIGVVILLVQTSGAAVSWWSLRRELRLVEQVPASGSP